jgi:hypothetical protein
MAEPASASESAAATIVLFMRNLLGLDLKSACTPVAKRIEAGLVRPTETSRGLAGVRRSRRRIAALAPFGEGYIVR